MIRSWKKAMSYNLKSSACLGLFFFKKKGGTIAHAQDGKSLE